MVHLHLRSAPAAPPDNDLPTSFDRHCKHCAGAPAKCACPGECAAPDGSACMFSHDVPCVACGIPRILRTFFRCGVCPDRRTLCTPCFRALPPAEPCFAHAFVRTNRPGTPVLRLRAKVAGGELLLAGYIARAPPCTRDCPSDECTACSETTAGATFLCGTCEPPVSLCEQCFVAGMHDLAHAFTMDAGVVLKPPQPLLPRGAKWQPERPHLIPQRPHCQHCAGWRGGCGCEEHCRRPDGSLCLPSFTATCVECSKTPIIGHVYFCGNCTGEASVCAECYGEGRHDLAHPFVRQVSPQDRVQHFAPRAFGGARLDSWKEPHPDDYNIGETCASCRAYCFGGALIKCDACTIALCGPCYHTGMHYFDPQHAMRNCRTDKINETRKGLPFGFRAVAGRQEYVGPDEVNGYHVGANRAHLHSRDRANIPETKERLHGGESKAEAGPDVSPAVNGGASATTGHHQAAAVASASCLHLVGGMDDEDMSESALDEAAVAAVVAVPATIAEEPPVLQVAVDNGRGGDAEDMMIQQMQQMLGQMQMFSEQGHDDEASANANEAFERLGGGAFPQTEMAADMTLDAHGQSPPLDLFEQQLQKPMSQQPEALVQQPVGKHLAQATLSTAAASGENQQPPFCQGLPLPQPIPQEQQHQPVQRQEQQQQQNLPQQRVHLPEQQQHLIQQQHLRQPQQLVQQQRGQVRGHMHTPMMTNFSQQEPGQMQGQMHTAMMTNTPQQQTGMRQPSFGFGQQQQLPQKDSVVIAPYGPGGTSQTGGPMQKAMKIGGAFVNLASKSVSKKYGH